MEPDPNISRPEGNSRNDSAPPPPLPPEPSRHSGFAQTIAIGLSLFLGLFLADAAVSLADDSLILFFNNHVLAAFRGILFVFTLLMALLVYVLMGFTPVIPKRWFLPLSLFYPVAGFLVIPCAIYFFEQMQRVSWFISLGQVILGLILLRAIQGQIKFRWPLVSESRLGTIRFSWRNLFLFALVNILGLFPVAILYFAVCSSLAVNHFSDGFLSLRPGGLTVEVRKYVRPDGATIQLVPMAHVGDAAFYRELSQSFPTNAIVLMEGVTDRQNLLTNKITYKRMASSLGLAEQREEFQPRGEMVQADIDVDQFSTNTLQLLNMIMLVHANGVNEQTLLAFTQYSPPPHIEKQLFDDLLRKRNRHLLGKIQLWLSNSENLIVPWGAAHIPEIAKEIQKNGFRLETTQEFKVIQFGFGGKKTKSLEKKRKQSK